MSVSASGLSMGWSGVTYGPAGGSVVTLTEVTNVELDRKGTQKKFYGDAAPWAKMIVIREKVREITITSGDVFGLSLIPEDTPLTITATHNDARNGTGAGAVTITLLNAVVVQTPLKGQVNEFGQASVTLAAASADGTTDPLTITRV